MEKDRRLEISKKTVEMASALIKEGEETKNADLIAMGNIFMALGGLVLNEDDMLELEDYMGYFIAKKTQEKIAQISKGLGGFGSIFNSPPNED